MSSRRRSRSLNAKYDRLLPIRPPPGRTLSNLRHKRAQRAQERKALFGSLGLVDVQDHDSPMADGRCTNHIPMSNIAIADFMGTDRLVGWESWLFDVLIELIQWLLAVQEQNRLAPAFLASDGHIDNWRTREMYSTVNCKVTSPTETQRPKGLGPGLHQQHSLSIAQSLTWANTTAPVRRDQQRGLSITGHGSGRHGLSTSHSWPLTGPKAVRNSVSPSDITQFLGRPHRRVNKSVKPMKNNPLAERPVHVGLYQGFQAVYTSPGDVYYEHQPQEARTPWSFQASPDRPGPLLPPLYSMSSQQAPLPPSSPPQYDYIARKHKANRTHMQALDHDILCSTNTQQPPQTIGSTGLDHQAELSVFSLDQPAKQLKTIHPAIFRVSEDASANHNVNVKDYAVSPQGLKVGASSGTPRLPSVCSAEENGSSPGLGPHGHIRGSPEAKSAGLIPLAINREGLEDDLSDEADMPSRGVSQSSSHIENDENVPLRVEEAAARRPMLEDDGLYETMSAMDMNVNESSLQPPARLHLPSPAKSTPTPDPGPLAHLDDVFRNPVFSTQPVAAPAPTPVQQDTSDRAWVALTKAKPTCNEPVPVQLITSIPPSPAIAIPSEDEEDIGVFSDSASEPTSLENATPLSVIEDHSTQNSPGSTDEQGAESTLAALGPPLKKVRFQLYTEATDCGFTIWRDGY